MHDKQSMGFVLNPLRLITTFPIAKRLGAHSICGGRMVKASTETF